MEKGALARTLWRICRSSQARLVLFSLLIWLGVACLTVFLLLAERRQVERKAESDALGVSTLLEARLAGTLQRVQADLEHLALRLLGDRRAWLGFHLWSLPFLAVVAALVWVWLFIVRGLA